MSFFITFEGVEGSGKTTQIKMLAETLTQKGYSVLLTRQPGGTAIGRKIREILLHRESEGLSALSELFLYAADRAQHCEEVVKPALHRDQIVLCDRFADATTAYQEGGRELPTEIVGPINKKACMSLVPDLTFLIDLPVEEGLKRAHQRGARLNDTQDRFERLELLFHQRVRDRYLRIAREEPQRMVIVDGTGKIEEVQHRIWDKLESVLKRKVGGKK